MLTGLCKAVVILDTALERELVQAFVKLGASGYTTTECKGAGRKTVYQEPFASHSQLRVEVVGARSLCEAIVRTVPWAGLAVGVQRDPSFRLWGWSLLLVMIGLTLGGCNKSSVKLNPVHGQVFFKDQPLEGAQIVFQPAGGATNEQPMAYGTAAADGSFDLSTHPYGPGAVAGDYVVFITKYGPDPKDPEKSVSKLPAKYADQSAPFLKLTVKEGKNELEPFRLK